MIFALIILKLEKIIKKYLAFSKKYSYLEESF